MDIGGKIRELRNLKGLTQEELADRAELTKGFISQVERNLTSPSIATLMDILQCLGTTAGDFFNEAPEEQIVFGQHDYFEKEDPEYGNLVKWIIPNAQKNGMEPILLTLTPGAVSYTHLPLSKTFDPSRKPIKIRPPVSQSAAFLASSAKPSVIQHKKLYAVFFRRPGNLHQFFFIKIKIRGFPVVNQNRTFLIPPFSSDQPLSIQTVESLAHAVQSLMGIYHDCLRRGKLLPRF